MQAMSHNLVQDTQMMHDAVAEILVDLKKFIKKHESPRSIKDCVENSADLQALANRYDNVVRAVIVLHGRQIV